MTPEDKNFLKAQYRRLARHAGFFVWITPDRKEKVSAQMLMMGILNDLGRADGHILSIEHRYDIELAIYFLGASRVIELDNASGPITETTGGVAILKSALKNEPEYDRAARLLSPMRDHIIRRFIGGSGDTIH